MLDTQEILSFLQGPLKQFPDRSAKKFDTLFLGVQSEPDARLLKTERPFGWLMTVLKHEDSDADVFAGVLAELGEYLGRLTEAERASWKQAIYYLYLFIFHRRSVEERQTLNRIVSEHHETLGLSEQEEHLMQSMAEHYLEQGKAEGKAELYQEIAEWNKRRLAAEARNETFTEPFPEPPEPPQNT